MTKTFFTYVTVVAMAFYLLTACAEETKDADATAQTESATEQVTETTATDRDSLMDQPVNFANAEAVEKTLKNIREQEGENAYKHLEAAMQYIQFYDLSLSNDKEKLYKKLDRKTPKEIIAMAKRR
jgi:hypothetical protein